jgi:replicative DNA helicase
MTTQEWSLAGSESLISVADLLRGVLSDSDGYDRRHARFSTGMFPLDDALGGGYRRQDLVLITGRPGAGKTIMALQWARAAAIHGAHVIYVSYEHSPEMLLERFATLEIASSRREEHVDHACDSPGPDPFERYADRLNFVRASSRHTDIEAIDRFVTEHARPNTVVFVDYLQKVAAPEATSCDENDRTRLVAEGLKDLALRRDVAVVAIAAADKDALKERRLRMHHMRGSSALMYEADIVLALNEKSRALSKRHLAFDAQRAQLAERYVVVSVEKNRSGVADLDMEFAKDFAHFSFEPQGTFLAEQLVDGVLYGE